MKYILIVTDGNRAWIQALNGTGTPWLQSIYQARLNQKAYSDNGLFALAWRV